MKNQNFFQEFRGIRPSYWTQQLLRGACGLLLASGLLLLSSCSVHENKNGDQANVDIKTPVGGLHIDTNTNAQQTGMVVYPGARPKPKTGDDNSNANVNISSSLFGLKVVVAQFLSDDSPDKVAGYYRKELGKYGPIIECHTSHGFGNVDAHVGHSDGASGKDRDHQLHCEQDSGDILELKVGTEDHQHVVAIKPNGTGSEFALVYVNAHGKDEAL